MKLRGSLRTYKTNALTNPRAMVIKFLNAIVANRAMGATRRTVEHTRVTVFHPHSNTVDYNFFRSRKLEAWCLSSPMLGWHRRLVTNFIFWGMWIPWNYTRVPGGSKEKQHQYLWEQPRDHFISNLVHFLFSSKKNSLLELCNLIKKSTRHQK